MHTFQVGKVVLMASKYDAETRARAVRLVRDHVGDYESEFAAIRAVAGRLGMSTEALRRWVRQAEVDAGQAPGVTSESAGVRVPHPGGLRPRPVAPDNPQPNPKPCVTLHQRQRGIQ